jgi:hypothetical protein
MVDVEVELDVKVVSIAFEGGGSICPVDDFGAGLTYCKSTRLPPYVGELKLILTSVANLRWTDKGIVDLVIPFLL